MRLLGSNIYNRSGAGQTQTRVSKNLKPARFCGAIENDGDAPDSLTLSATKGNRLFKTSYLVDGQNFTASLIAGSYLKLLPVGEKQTIGIKVNPSRKLKRRKSGKIKRKKFFATISSTSSLDSSKSDVVRGQTKTK